MPRRLLAVLLTWLATACGEDANRLYGSVEQIYDLQFDTVAVSTVGEFLVIEYTRPEGKVAKLSVNQSGLTIVPDQEIDLTVEIGGTARGTLQRILGGTIELPLQLGTLVLESVPADDEELTGRFRTTLSDPAGRTLNGDFSAPVVAL